MNNEYTELQLRAIARNTDLPEDVAVAFAEELEEIVEDAGITLGEILTPQIDPSSPPAKPGSIQEMFPYLRDPRYV